jgi:hypothetical protein
MRQFYTTSTKLKDLLEADANVNTVTIGDITEVDLSKQGIFPLSHLMPIEATMQGNTIELTYTVICMDVVDFNKEDVRDVPEAFYGNNDLHDIWNTQLAVMNRLIENLRRGTATPFKDRFENLLAGWAADISIIVPNNEICIS